MASGRLIDYLGRGLLAARPATPDLATGGLGFYYATDNSTLYAWDGTAWQAVTSGSAGQVNTVVAGAKISVDSTDPVNPVVSAPTLQPFTVTATESGTTLTALPAAAWGYVRFTNSGTKTYTFDSAQSYVTDTEFHGRNVGAGALTIAGAGSFVVTPPAGGALTVAQGQSFIVKITGTNTADLILQMGAGGAPPTPSPPPEVIDFKYAAQATSGTALTYAYPATVNPGDLLVVMASSFSSITWDALTGFTITHSSTYRRTAYKVCDGSEGGTTLTIGTPTSGSSIPVYTAVLVKAGTYAATNTFSTDAWVRTTPSRAAGVLFNGTGLTAPAGGWTGHDLFLGSFIQDANGFGSIFYPFPDNHFPNTSVLGPGRLCGFSTFGGDISTYYAQGAPEYGAGNYIFVGIKGV